MKLSAKQTASLAVRALLIIAVVFTADRVVKQWCIEVLRPQGSIAFWPGVLHFTYAENTGAAFSILSGRRLLLTLLPIAALGLLLFLYFRRLYAHPLTDFALPLIMGGALGNLYDRMPTAMWWTFWKSASSALPSSTLPTVPSRWAAPCSSSTLFCTGRS